MLNELINGGSVPVLDAMMSFTQARHRVLAENIANVDTPGYRTRDLDAGRFQAALGKAVARRNQGGGGGGLPIEDGAQFAQRPDGGLEFRADEQPAENVLFHDGTNVRIESQMAALAENAMMHQAASELLALQYNGMMRAIRGTV